MTWNGNRLPPLDLRMVRDSYYDTRNIGLTYKETIVTKLAKLDRLLEELVIYPNPVEQLFYIKSDSKIKNVTFIDLTGKEVLFIENYNSNDPIHNSVVTTGIYFAKVRFENGNVVTQKFVVH